MREMKVAQSRHILGIAHESIWGEQGDTWGAGRKGLKIREAMSMG
jgi:hypothetical protein